MAGKIRRIIQQVYTCEVNMKKKLVIKMKRERDKRKIKRDEIQQ